MITLFIFLGNTPLNGALLHPSQKPLQQTTMKAHIWMVDNEGDGDFTTIQQAIDAADIGDTIIVFSGTYTENLNIGKDALIIEGKDYELGQGNDEGKPLIIPISTEKAINFICDETEFSGFNIQPTTNKPVDKGIAIYSSHNTIRNNTITNTQYAFYLYSVEGNLITNNNISQTLYGFYLINAENNHVESNHCSSVDIGCYFNISHENSLSTNTFDCITNGMIFDHSVNNEMNQNIILNCNTGVSINTAQSNVFIGNTFSKNTQAVSIYESSLNKFIGNSLQQNTDGFYLYFGSNGNNITQNTIAYNTNAGIRISGSSTNMIHNNDIKFNTDGIILSQSTYNTVVLNTIQSNNNGIYLQGSRICNIKNNQLLANTHGISLNYTYDNTITENNISSYQFGECILIQNSHDELITKNMIQNAGISLYSSYDVSITENSISNALDGIYFKGSSTNTIYANTIASNKFNGVSLDNQSVHNIFYHNNFLNNNQHAIESNSNYWDNSYPSGGNYWDDYNGTDANYDGRGDTSYPIPGYIDVDAYPLMFLWGAPAKPERPKGPSQGKIGTTYTYSTQSADPNGDKIQFGWDWTGDERVDEWTVFYDSGTEVSISHSWVEDGQYAVSVKAIDLHGVESEWSDPLQISMPHKTEISVMIWLKQSISQWIPSFLL